jgi:YVTN family beta-propeller protein
MKPFFLLRTAPLAGLALSGLLYSCEPKEKEDPKPVVDPPVAVRHDSVYVVNQGQFGTPNGSVSLFVKSTKASEKDPFQRVNSRTLGDVVQSMTVVGNRGYVVANNSNKVEVVNLPDFRSAGTITGLALPRYLVAASADKAYLTEWVNFGQNGRVAVLNLRTNTVTSTIPVGKLPEQPLLSGGKLYVPNSDENTVTVINTSTDQVETTLTISDGPNSLTADAAGNVWVLCGGITRYATTPPYNVISSTPAKLVRLNPAAPTTGRLELPFASGGAADLQAAPGKQQLYYRYSGGVYRLDATATALPTTPLIRRRLNGLGVDPNDGQLYGGVGNFSSDGRTVRYSTTGAAVDSFSVGIGPSGFAFR